MGPGWCSGGKGLALAAESTSLQTLSPGKDRTPALVQRSLTQVEQQGLWGKVKSS